MAGHDGAVDGAIMPIMTIPEIEALNGDCTGPHGAPLSSRGIEALAVFFSDLDKKIPVDQQVEFLQRLFVRALVNVTPKVERPAWLKAYAG